jgi:Putative Ig domain
MLLLAGCGDSEDEGSAGTIAPSGSVSGNSGGGGGSTSGNAAPTISGTPRAQVAVGQKYTFQPIASDPNGDTLTFTVVNLPSWASFNRGNGAISGTPGSGDIRNYADIRVSVSDGTFTTALPSFSIAVVDTGSGVATLSWTPPTTNTDGSALLDLDGYRIYWGPEPENFTNSVEIDKGAGTTYVVEGLTIGTWYFAATAANARGIESAFSNVASKTITQ